MKRKIAWRNATDYDHSNPLAKLGDHLGFNRDELARAIQVSGSVLPGYVAPLDHPQYRVPPTKVLERIYVWSGGLIRPDSFYPVRAWQADGPVPVAPDAAVFAGVHGATQEASVGATPTREI